MIAGESVPALRANLDFYRYIIYILIYTAELSKNSFLRNNCLEALQSSKTNLGYIGTPLAGSVLLGTDIKCIKFKVSLEYGMVEPYGFVPKCHT